MNTKRRKRHTPEQIVRKLRDADAMLNAGQELAMVLQTLEVSVSPIRTRCRRRIPEAPSSGHAVPLQVDPSSESRIRFHESTCGPSRRWKWESDTPSHRHRQRSQLGESTTKHDPESIAGQHSKTRDRLALQAASHGYLQQAKQRHIGRFCRCDHLVRRINSYEVCVWPAGT